MRLQIPKRKTRSDKFPLTLHPTGQYCKKIRGKVYYFGADKQGALTKYFEQAKWLHTGETLPRSSAVGIDVKTLCNLYLEYQETRINAGEIRLRQLYDQTRLLKQFVKYLNANGKVVNITTMDIQQYRSYLVKAGKGASTVNSHISAFKAMFNWAFDNEIITSMPNLKAIKKISAHKESRFTFTMNQIKKLLAEANTQMRAMIWLGLNCGFGCTDCSELLWKNIDFENGRVNFARTKTNIGRNLPLWKETIEALKMLPHFNERIFNTSKGNKYVRVEVKQTSDGTTKMVSLNSVTKEFSRLLENIDITIEKGVGFYTLRRTAATMAARSGDPFAVQKLLGHADLKMASVYVQDVSEQTDKVINNSRKLILEQDKK